MSDFEKNAPPPPPAAAGASSDASVAPGPGIVASQDGEKNGAGLWPILEADLPAQLGVSRDIIRAIRTGDLRQGEEWQRVHKDVRLNRRGLEILKFKLGCLAAQPPAPAGAGTGLEGLSVEEPPPAVANARELPPVELIVVRANFINKRVITARRPEDTAKPANVVTVFVKASNLFRPGMSIQARQVGPNRFEFQGHYPKKSVGLTVQEAAAAALKAK